MLVFVKFPSGKIVRVDARIDGTVADIKNALAKYEDPAGLNGLNLKSSRLYLRTRMLRDEENLGSLSLAPQQLFLLLPLTAADNRTPAGGARMVPGPVFLFPDLSPTKCGRTDPRQVIEEPASQGPAIHGLPHKDSEVAGHQQGDDLSAPQPRTHMMRGDQGTRVDPRLAFLPALVSDLQAVTQTVHDLSADLVKVFGSIEQVKALDLRWPTVELTLSTCTKQCSASAMAVEKQNTFLEEYKRDVERRILPLIQSAMRPPPCGCLERLKSLESQKPNKGEVCPAQVAPELEMCQGEIQGLKTQLSSQLQELKVQRELIQSLTARIEFQHSQNQQFIKEHRRRLVALGITPFTWGERANAHCGTSAVS